MARYKSAIIACGTIARCHARGWQGVPDVELAAIAETNEDARDEFGEFFGIPSEHRYADYREMLDAARQPKAILSQKPMALSLGECDRMVAQEAVDWVDGKIDDPLSSGAKGRATLEILMALYESARKRRRVELPLKTLANPLQLMVESGELPVEWPGAYETRARLVRDEGMAW